MSLQPPPPLERPAAGVSYLYGLDQWPPSGALVLFALQWLVVLVPGLLVLGDVIAGAQGLAEAGKVAFLQRLLLACAVAQAAQVWWGHRLPGLVGPSAVLMVGVLSTVEAGSAAVYGGIMVAGAVAALVGLTGLASRLSRLFTRPVLASTLMLIAVTLAPAMRGMLLDPATKGGAAVSLFFGVLLTLGMLFAQYRLKGIWSSSVLVMGLAAGSLVYHLGGLATAPVGLGLSPWLVALPGLPPQAPSFQPAVIAAFCLCYLAVMSNELATVEALGELSRAPGMDRRANGAVAVGGLGGVLGGLLGVPGPVTYAVSPAVAIGSRNLSRFALLPVAAVLVLLSFWPGGLSLFSLAPPPVVGAVLLHLMAGTVFAALGILTGEAGGQVTWRQGVVVGMAMCCGLVVAFMPPEVKAALPPTLAPLLANGFVVGLAAALVLEHLLLRRP